MYVIYLLYFIIAFIIIMMYSIEMACKNDEGKVCREPSCGIMSTCASKINWEGKQWNHRLVIMWGTFQ